ncbi:SUKH-3 domain-containing protein [Streptomyces phaeochromogenes]|uniref:SUKH-3 domain-containing protein n=1 Tax=Streptomyces phaeochromogenes TaxID=1923 RepID=UPI002E29ECA3|nr:SUKH-3 domain-containing protein [Streptomyces phaeochromogenes]
MTSSNYGGGPEMSDELPPGWSSLTYCVLRAAAWYPDRSVPTGEWEKALHEHGGFEMHDAARRLLAEFGGLEFRLKGPGRTMARSPFRIDPLLAKWDFEIIDLQSEEVGTCLYPIGDADRGNFYLTMAADGAVHHGMDYVCLLADNGDKALEKLIEGRK